MSAFLAKFYEAVIIAMAAFLFLLLVGLGIQSWRANHWQGKFQSADAECVERINKVNKAYQDALDAWKSKVFIVEDELEAERNNIKIEFRDIRHETQKIITDRIYTDCKFTDDGLRIAQTAIATANSSKSID